MLDAQTALWTRGEMARNESRAVERLQLRLRQCAVTLRMRHARGVDRVSVRTLDGGVIRWEENAGGRLMYFATGRSRNVRRGWQPVSGLSDWWALRDCEAACEELAAEHLRQAAGGGE